MTSLRSDFGFELVKVLCHIYSLYSEIFFSVFNPSLRSSGQLQILSQQSVPLVRDADWRINLTDMFFVLFSWEVEG